MYRLRTARNEHHVVRPTQDKISCVAWPLALGRVAASMASQRYDAESIRYGGKEGGWATFFPYGRAHSVISGAQLRGLITGANAGDTIILPAGCTITLTAAAGPIQITKTLTLVGGRGDPDGPRRGERNQGHPSWIMRAPARSTCSACSRASPRTLHAAARRWRPRVARAPGRPPCARAARGRCRRRQSAICFLSASRRSASLPHSSRRWAKIGLSPSRGMPGSRACNGATFSASAAIR